MTIDKDIHRACVGINPYHQPISQAVINVPAGATLTAQVCSIHVVLYAILVLTQNSQWHHTLNQAPNDPADPIDASHKGPIISYLYASQFVHQPSSWVAHTEFSEPRFPVQLRLM